MFTWIGFFCVQQKHICETWIVEKQHRQSFPKNRGHRTSQLLGIIHFNICDPLYAYTHFECQYFLTFIHDFSQFITIFIEIKFQIFHYYKNPSGESNMEKNFDFNIYTSGKHIPNEFNA
jgi:hypothetical protein